MAAIPTAATPTNTILESDPRAPTAPDSGAFDHDKSAKPLIVPTNIRVPIAVMISDNCGLSINSATSDAAVSPSPINAGHKSANIPNINIGPTINNQLVKVLVFIISPIHKKS